MKPCKCGKNDWSYLKLDNTNYIKATCKGCGNQIQWELKKKEKQEMADGAKCRACPGTLKLKALKITEKKIERKEYYYTHAFKCSKCPRFYYSKEYYVENQGFEYPKGAFDPRRKIALKGISADTFLVLQNQNSDNNELWVEIKRIKGKVAGTDKYGVPFN